MKFISTLITVLSLNSIIAIAPKAGGGYIITPIDPEEPVEITHPLVSTVGAFGAFNGSTNQNVTFKLNESGGSFNLVLNFLYLNTGNKYGSKTYDLDTVTTNNYQFNVNFLLKNRMTNGVIVRVSTEYKYTTNVKMFDINLYPTITDTIYSYNYRNNSYNISNRAFAIEDNVVYSSETVNFKDTIDYLTNDISNSFDVSEIVFTHNSKLPLNSTGGYLYIEDEDSALFPNLDHVDNGVKFPIKTRKNANTNDVYLESNFTYYYNNLTLDMSKTKVNANYQSTNRIFIKKTMMSALENKTIYVRLPSILKSGTTIEIPLQFIKDKNFVGLCSDSNHCIVGGIKE